MRTPAYQRRPGPARGLASLAAVLLAVGACGSSGTAAPATGSAPSNAPTTTAHPTPTIAPSASPFAELTLLWQAGGPTVEANTYWPAIDPLTGNVWVASSFDNQYWIISADGEFLEAWGTPGNGPGQFKLTTNDPRPDAVGAIAFAPDGSFYVVDNGNYRVQKFDKNRHLVRMWGNFGTGDGQFANPKGIATDGKTVYVADDGRLDIQAFDTNGGFVRSFPFPFVLFNRAPTGHLFVAVDAEHRGRDLDPTGLLELDGTGKQVHHFDLDFAALGGSAAQTAVDEAGHIFVELQDHSGPVGLVELDPGGGILNSWSSGGETMALAPDGKAVYVASYGWDFIRKYALP